MTSLPRRARPGSSRPARPRASYSIPGRKTRGTFRERGWRRDGSHPRSCRPVRVEPAARPSPAADHRAAPSGPGRSDSRGDPTFAHRQVSGWVAKSNVKELRTVDRLVVPKLARELRLLFI